MWSNPDTQIKIGLKPDLKNAIFGMNQRCNSNLSTLEIQENLFISKLQLNLAILGSIRKATEIHYFVDTVKSLYCAAKV